MPELPEAETIARGLRRVMQGERLGRPVLVRRDVVKGNPKSFSRQIAGRRVEDVGRRGKRVIVRLDDGARILFALGMTGRVTADPVESPCESHTHLRIPFGDGEYELRFRDVRRFGGVWYLNGTQNADILGPGPLGPEPLEISVNDFVRLLQRKRQVKAMLMDQHVIAGLGNIYCDEALHRAGIHPLTQACSLSRKRAVALRRAVQHVLREAIKLEGSTFLDYRTADGRPGKFQLKHRVYNRAGQPCRACKGPIERIVAAGRSTHFCPRCQPSDTH